jgi:hypothetical protein
MEKLALGISSNILSTEWRQIVISLSQCSLKSINEFRRSQIETVFPLCEGTAEEYAFAFYQKNFSIALIEGFIEKLYWEKEGLIKHDQSSEFMQIYTGWVPVITIDVINHRHPFPKWLRYVRFRLQEEGWRVSLIRLKTMVYRWHLTEPQLFYRYQIVLCVNDPR